MSEFLFAGGGVGDKEMSEKCPCYKCETFYKTDIPTIPLIVYSCIWVKYRKYKAGINDYSGVCLSMNWKGSSMFKRGVWPMKG